MGNATKTKIKLNKSLGYKILFLVLLIVSLIRPLSVIYSLRDNFLSGGYAKIYPVLKAGYLSSQYVQKVNPGIMPDESFESYVAGAFLKGINPILIVHEHPPMGRYILALSIFLFDSAKTIIIPLTFIATFGVFLISRLVLKNAVFALIPVAIFINEPLFINKFYYIPLLEPVQQPFIVFGLYFFMKGLVSKKYAYWFSLASIMLGFVISIRFFILGAVMVFAMVSMLLIEKNYKQLKAFILVLPLSLIVLILSYTRTIQDGYSVFQVFSIQKYIYYYHKYQLISPLSFWDLMLFNRWHTWWGSRAILSDPHWMLWWPLSIAGTIILGLLRIVKKVKLTREEKVILLWVLSYSLLLSVGNSTTRYFFPLLPFYYILAVSGFIKLFYLFSGHYNKKGKKYE